MVVDTIEIKNNVKTKKQTKTKIEPTTGLLV